MYELVCMLRRWYESERRAVLTAEWCDLDEKGNLELWMVLSCQTFVPIEICGGIDLAMDTFWLLSIW